MGCITARGWRVGESLRAGGHKVGESLMASAERYGEGLAVFGSRLGAGLMAMAQRLGEGLRVSASVVCDAGYPTITIEPDYIWLTPSNAFTADVEVITMTEWEVVR